MILLRRFGFYSTILSLGFFPLISTSEESKPWPEVLTLEFALQQASADHPDLLMARADVDSAHAEQLSVEAFSGIESKISGQLRWVDPPEIAYDQDRGDHKLSLFANKRLYDFGYTTSLEEAAEAGVSSKEYMLQYALNQHRIAIMAAYFDVLLADLRLARDQEAMTVAFLTADKAKDRNELGMMSDIDLLELESISQARLVDYRRSSYLQHSTRTRLANVLNVPGHPQADLETPGLASNDRKLPEDVEEWMAIAEKQNPMLLASQAKLLAADKRLESARGLTNPVLTGEVEVSKYAREAGGYDNWRAGVTLDIPLRTSGKAKAVVAKSRAEVLKVKAEMEQQRRNVRQSLIELLDELKTLIAERKSIQALMEYRELYLDRSRAIYQMEVKADLGDAESKIADAKFKIMKNKFAIAMVWARIEAMLGETVFTGKELKSQARQEVNP